MNLQNNHPQMKTVVETFIIEETAELIYDGEKLDEWNKKVEELGLKGQTQILQKDKSPVPFMHMNHITRVTLETLCPRKVSVEDYNVTPIPLEILDLVALSKNEGYFDKIQIWYDDKTPDPACIGLRYTSDEARQKGYSWNMESYLIGKWADVKESFEKLTERALKRFKQEKTAELNEKIRKAKRELEDMDALVNNHFTGTSTFPF